MALARAALVIALQCLAGHAAADEGVPQGQQALLLLRTLAYDRNLAARAGAEATVLVLFKPGDAASTAAKDAMLTALATAAEKVKVAGLPVRALSRPLGRDSLHLALGEAGAVALYLCPGLEDASAEVAAATRATHVLSFAGSRASVEAGISIGFVGRDGKAVVMVNLPAAKAEGADLDSGLLRVAEVVR